MISCNTVRVFINYGSVFLSKVYVCVFWELLNLADAVVITITIYIRKDKGMPRISAY